VISPTPNARRAQMADFRNFLSNECIMSGQILEFPGDCRFWIEEFFFGNDA